MHTGRNCTSTKETSTGKKKKRQLLQKTNYMSVRKHSNHAVENNKALKILIYEC